jgi:lipid A 3-O-deacylase
MKIRLLFLALFALSTGKGSLFAQSTPPTHLLSLYWDDDYLNIQGKGTDRAYTSGQRIEFYYLKQHPSRFFADRIIPKAGSHSTDIYSWSLMQIMVTPDNISDPNFQPNDYPWSGALFATHSLYSYNRERKFAFKSEALLGVMGPASLAGPTQRQVHSLIHYRVPQGWSNQFANTPLVNVAFSVEKQEWGWKNFLEVISGARIDAGTMMDGLTAYQLVRIGIMDHYFDGLFTLSSASGQSRKRTEFYLFMKPQAQAVAYDALLQGSIFSSKPTFSVPSMSTDKITGTSKSYHDINNLLFEVDYGGVLSVGTMSIAYTQKPTTAYMKGLYKHNVGNITVSKSW